MVLKQLRLRWNLLVFLPLPSTLLAVTEGEAARIVFHSEVGSDIFVSKSPRYHQWVRAGTVTERGGLMAEHSRRVSIVTYGGTPRHRCLLRQ